MSGWLITGSNSSSNVNAHRPRGSTRLAILTQATVGDLKYALSWMVGAVSAQKCMEPSLACRLMELLVSACWYARHTCDLAGTVLPIMFSLAPGRRKQPSTILWRMVQDCVRSWHSEDTGHWANTHGDRTWIICIYIRIPILKSTTASLETVRTSEHCTPILHLPPLQQVVGCNVPCNFVAGECVRPTFATG
jgi:hypothetical protein